MNYVLKDFFQIRHFFENKDCILFGNLENSLLVRIGSLDLEFLHLGLQKGGTFDEKDIENSELKRLGVGRILDSVASLKDRGLISQNSDGKFTITNTTRQILWNKEIPLWVKILRLLDIKAFSLKTISMYLGAESDKILEELETLRKNELVLMSPLRTETGLEKMYELMPAGAEQIEKIESEGFENAKLILKKDSNQEEIFAIIDEIKESINKEGIDEKTKSSILEKLEKIKSKLKI